MGNKLLDTNSILRYMLNDIESQANETEEVIKNGAFTIPEVIPELVYVLSKNYKLDRGTVSYAISEILDEIDIDNKEVVKHALNRYARSNLDYVDCIILARAELLNEEVFSFDKKKNKMV